MNEIRIFTDGACKANGKKGAVASYAAFFPEYPEWSFAYKIPEDLYTHVGNLWQNGMSFEDILHAIQQTAELYFVLPSESQERLYMFLVTGWSYHAQSRCSFLDILGCAMDVGLLDTINK
jgi:hypothetical protein